MTSSEALDTAYEAYRARRIFGSLDGIRCLSILAVLWHHTTDGFSWLPASRMGFLGVDMFFVLSGFLIVSLLLRERDLNGEISLRRFYIRRSLRIFPVYYGVLSVLTVVFWLRPHGHMAQGFFKDLPYYLTYLTNWIHPATFMGIAWSLAAEEQFYLLWPPIERWLGRSAMAILLLVIAANQLPSYALASRQTEGWLGVMAGWPMSRVTYTPICLGVLLAHLLHTRNGYKWIARALFAPWMPIACLAALFLTCNLVPENIAGWPRLIIQVWMMFLLASCVIRDDHWLRGILEASPIARIGAISYGIYLYHMIARHAAVALLASIGLRFPLDRSLLVLLISWVIAELSYRYYETPFLKLKDAIRRRPAVAVGDASRVVVAGTIGGRPAGACLDSSPIRDSR
jgi:peptidoglycan/LPS O-acetylase OafA/YrhL